MSGVQHSNRGVHLELLRAGAPSILDVFDSTPWFKPASNYTAWRSFIAAAFGLPMTDEEVAIFQKCTGRREPPTEEADEITSIVGRRGGKTSIDAFVMGYLATYRDYRQYLREGETCFFPIVAADKKGTRQACGYLKAWFQLDPHKGICDLSHADAEQERYFEFYDVPVRIEVFTASFRTVRSYTVGGFLGDECAYWRTKDDSANPDREIIRAVRPTMATIPRAKLMLLSSPYFQDGVLWDHFDNRWGRDISKTLVWKAPTTYMNPTKQVQIHVDTQYALDAIAAEAEYGANFRADTSKFITETRVRELTLTGVEQLPPKPLRDQNGMPVPKDQRATYFAFVDVSGGSSDAFTLAIAHWDYEVQKAVLDVCVGTPAPYHPRDVIKEYKGVLMRYRCTRVIGDSYGGVWPRELFADYEIAYDVCEWTKHELYKETLPAMNSHEVVLLDVLKLRQEYVGLLRRKSPNGREVIDHPRDGHDDYCNAAAGALFHALTEGRWLTPEKVAAPAASTTHEIVEQMAAEMLQEMVDHMKDPDSDKRPDDARYSRDDMWASD